MVRRARRPPLHQPPDVSLRLPRPHQDRRAGPGFRPDLVPRQERAAVLRSGDTAPARRRRRGDGAGGLRARRAARAARRHHHRHRDRRHDHHRGGYPPVPREGGAAAPPHGAEADPERLPSEPVDALRPAGSGLRGRLGLFLGDAGDRPRHADDPRRHGRCRGGRRHGGPHHQQRHAGLGSPQGDDTRLLPPLLEGPQRHGAGCGRRRGGPRVGGARQGARRDAARVSRRLRHLHGRQGPRRARRGGRRAGDARRVGGRGT